MVDYPEQNKGGVWAMGKEGGGEGEGKKELGWVRGREG